MLSNKYLLFNNFEITYLIIKKIKASGEDAFIYGNKQHKTRLYKSGKIRSI